MSELVKVTVPHEGREYDLWQGGDGEPLVKDTDFAEWLGYAQPRDIRKLADRYSDEIGVFSRHRGAKIDTDGKASRGRPEEGYLFTEAQALYLAAKSETKRASEILKAMIAVFLLARRGDAGGIEQGMYEQVMGELEETRVEVRELRAVLRGGLAMPCGRDEKRALTGLAQDVAELVLRVDLKAPIGKDARKSLTFRRKVGDELEAAAKAARVSGRAWDLLTVQEAAALRCHLQQRHRKLTRRLRVRTIPTNRQAGAKVVQMNLVK